ncbi:unnamed protein product [Acanthoscelides obtectus]|uniref:C2H2-type domain-containing protein n=1 Tax=Acanthoscelides obtectus TaxID=200917 RepID=A0A9P0P0R3_ACAOB|nr:unnamed protein product [Acanthoscelides obtectus]CAK1669697.1 Zinc finger protein 879 [Acanthoscelides obtectus]
MSDDGTNGGTAERKYSCKECGNTYKHRSSLNNHRRFACGKSPSFKCNLCSSTFSRKFSLRRHIQTEACQTSKHDFPKS